MAVTIAAQRPILAGAAVAIVLALVVGGVIAGNAFQGGSRDA